MHKRTLALTFILLLFVYSLSIAQEESIVWEEKYSDEAYINLLLERIVEINRDCSSKETIHMIVKVQKESAKSLGEIPIGYDKSFQKIKDIKAYIITPGRKKLRYKSIQDLTPYSGEPLYSDSRTKIITMPNVIPGSIIDWQVTIITKKPIIKDAFWDIFDFISETPIKFLRYKFIIPEGMPIQTMDHNTEIRSKIKKHRDKIIYSWEGKYLDKFEPEEYMPPYDDFGKYTIISNIKDWREITIWYRNLVNKNLKIPEQMRQSVADIVKGKNKMEDKIQAIIEYIQDNFRYVSMSFGYHRYEPHPSDEVFNNKYGDCKDQVLVFIAMLKEIGITSYPALYCDEDSGSPKDKLPMPAYFNHVILAIELDKKIYYTDILQKGYRFTDIPANLAGGYVFVVNDKEGFFDQLPILDELENTYSKESKIVIREDGSALIEITSLWSKEYSIDFRERWKNMTEKQKKEFIESLNETHTVGGNMLERKWENLDTRYGKIKSYIRYENPHWTAVIGGFMIFGGVDYGRNTYFAKEKRIYPIMFESNSLNKESFTYFIPKGFELVNLPKDIHLETEFAEFSRGFKKEGNRITETEIRRYKRIRLPASDYNKIKDFYNKLSQLTKEKIIIRKRLDRNF
ncbi:MAG: DUF3857 domain-containing protein [Candidatus Omnitrophica bacterium]|nr:DUF3857 domain-containing protein [Candidatus Omnitrophota bacterium]